MKRKSKTLSELDIELARIGYMDTCRAEARRQMTLVSIVLIAPLIGLITGLLILKWLGKF